MAKYKRSTPKSFYSFMKFIGICAFIAIMAVVHIHTNSFGVMGAIFILLVVYSWGVRAYAEDKMETAREAE